MGNGNKRILYREMMIDLHHRLRLADELFCGAAESLAAAAALEEWPSRSEALRKIGEYSRALQLVNVDFCRIMPGKHAVFPAELGEWTFDTPEGERAARQQLERLHAVSDGLEMTVNRELLQLELSRE